MFIIYNGTIFPVKTPIINADSPGLKHGFGLFETMKVFKGNVRLRELHMDRLLKGLSLLQFNQPPTDFILSLPRLIDDLCYQNRCHKSWTRVRLTVVRGSHLLGEPPFNYIIEANAIDPTYLEFYGKGQSIGVCKDIQKSCDILANLKTNNYLPYLIAKQNNSANRWDDCLILNTYGRVCETTIANVFGIKENKIITPALSEGCIAGVMRAYLIQKMQTGGYDVEEKEITVQELKDCDEIFLTNSIIGMKPVYQFEGKTYKIKISSELYHKFIEDPPSK